MQFSALAVSMFLAISSVAAAQKLNITLWNLPNYQAGEGVSAAGNPVTVNLGEDTYLGAVSSNLVDSAKIPSGYVCLFYGGYGGGICIEGEDEFECVDGDTPVLHLSNTFECVRCFGPGAACPK